jgi:class 3 adenylate cyclase
VEVARWVDGVLALFGSARGHRDRDTPRLRKGPRTGCTRHSRRRRHPTATDVYGGAVKIAARVSTTAPNEFLLSATMRDLARTSAGVVFDDCGQHTLKGVSGRIRMFRVQPSV